MIASRSVVIFITGMILIKGLTIYIGLCLYAKYEHCDPVASGIVEKSDQVSKHRSRRWPNTFYLIYFAADFASLCDRCRWKDTRFAWTFYCWYFCSWLIVDVVEHEYTVRSNLR